MSLSEYREKSLSELINILKRSKEEFYKLKVKISSLRALPEDINSFRRLKKDIARVKTIIVEKKLIKQNE